jgi:hypothetical protein
MSHLRLSRLALALAPLAPFIVSGCASVPLAGAKASETATIAAAAASAATNEAERGPRGRAAPGTPPHATAAAAAAAAAAQAAAAARPFSEVVKEAEETKGLFSVWRKDDKVYLEISPDQFDRPYFFKSAINQGIGEARIFGGAMTYPMGVAQIVEFHKHGHSVQLIAKNVKYTAKAGTPEARAVAAGFSDSLLAVAPIASQPEPERKSVLIDANALLLADIPGGAAVLERAYHQPYGFDARNSSIGAARAQDDEVSLEVSAHYALSRVVMPPSGERPHGSAPSTPVTLPDVRSLFIGYHYTLAKLPDTPMHPRIADERVGYFTTEVLDFTSDNPRVPVERYVNRWRLEKKDPAAALSEPKQPIVFWLDRNIPVRYREPIKEGILEWNKAFESSASRMRSTSRCSPTTPTSTRPTSAMRRCAGRRWPRRRTAPSGRASSTRAPARSSTRTSRSTPITCASCATCARSTCRSARTRSPRSPPPRAATRRRGSTRRRARTTTQPPKRRPSGCRSSRRAATSIPTAPTSIASSPCS